MTRHRIANIALTGALFLSMAAVLLGGPVPADTGVLPFIQVKAPNAEAAQRAAHHVTGCAIDSVERLEGGAA